MNVDGQKSSFFFPLPSSPCATTATQRSRQTSPDRARAKIGCCGTCCSKFPQKALQMDASLFSSGRTKPERRCQQLCSRSIFIQSLKRKIGIWGPSFVSRKWWSIGILSLNRCTINRWQFRSLLFSDVLAKLAMPPERSARFSPKSATMSRAVRTAEELEASAGKHTWKWESKNCGEKGLPIMVYLEWQADCSQCSANRTLYFHHQLTAAKNPEQINHLSLGEYGGMLYYVV